MTAYKIGTYKGIDTKYHGKAIGIFHARAGARKAFTAVFSDGMKLNVCTHWVNAFVD